MKANTVHGAFLEKDWKWPMCPSIGIIGWGPLHVPKQRNLDGGTNLDESYEEEVI